MAAKSIEQHHQFLLYQSVILSVIDYGLGLATLSQSNLLKLDGVQNETMRVLRETTRDTPIEATHCLLNLPPMETRHKVQQVKAYLNAMQNAKNPLHDAVKEETGCRLTKGNKSWMSQGKQSIQHACSLTELKQVRNWEKRPIEFKSNYGTLLPGTASAEVHMSVEANSKPHKRTAQSQRTGLAEVQSQAVWSNCTRRSGSHMVTISNLTIEAVTLAMQWLAFQCDTEITQLCTVFGCKYICGSIDLGMPESVGLN